MKRQSLWQISVVVTPEAEEAAIELLTRIFHLTPAVYTNEETKITEASVYCSRRSDWTPRKRTALEGGLKIFAANGLNVGSGKILCRRVAREDWSESWKKHFKPIEIGSRLLVKPSWIKRKPRKNQAVVVLDPGLSFGTGNHPTTAFCLRQLAAGRKPGQRQSFWDVGAGSGILAIAAAKLGYAPVHAMDFDPEAVRVARENTRKNKVFEKVRITRADITKLPANGKKFDFICANLISNLLLAERKRIISRLRPGGTLVLAGILKHEFAEVRRGYEDSRLQLSASQVEGEWESGAFILRNCDV